MNARDSLAAIVQWLQEIQEILADYGAAARSQQENNRNNPQRVRAEITFDDASKREAQDEAKRQNSTQEKIGRYAFYAFLPAIIPSSVQLPLRFPCKVQIRQGCKIRHSSRICDLRHRHWRAGRTSSLSP
jgi:hypothetical protein